MAYCPGKKQKEKGKRKKTKKGADARFIAERPPANVEKKAGLGVLSMAEEGGREKKKKKDRGVEGGRLLKKEGRRGSSPPGREKKKEREKDGVQDRCQKRKKKKGVRTGFPRAPQRGGKRRRTNARRLATVERKKGGKLRRPNPVGQFPAANKKDRDCPHLRWRKGGKRRPRPREKGMGKKKKELAFFFQAAKKGEGDPAKGR